MGSIPKPQRGQLWFTLNIYKYENTDLFRSYLRITPSGFDNLVSVLESHPVFQNKSNNLQIPVNHQIAVLLYRLGHYGNSASLTKVGHWAGLGHRTIDLITRRVLTAICASKFHSQTLRPPSEEEKEASRSFAEAKSCPEWRGGWCGVDGTCVPLHERPMLYGSSYFDCKCNYSTNVQVLT